MDPSLSYPAEFPYTDTDKHLIWSSRSKYTENWSGAAAYCHNLVEGGSNNWRLPTMDELKTLVRNCPEGGCELDITGKYSLFGDIIDLWSSTLDEGFNILHFMDVVESVFSPLSENEYVSAKVRCVRSEGDPETVSTGIEFPFDTGDLIWSKVSDEEYYSTNDAAQYCASLNEENYGGYNNWALPTTQEVSTLLKKSVCPNKSDFVSPSWNTRCEIYTFDGYSIFGDMFSVITQNADIDFSRGNISTGYPTGRARCVIRF